MIINKIRSIAIASLLALTAIPSAAQDLLARQAPVDRRSSAADTIVFESLRHRENMENPSSDLYPTWENRYAHKATPMPSAYKIDLRGFCMPTPSRVVTSNFGRRWGRWHKGLDIKVYIGDTIRAAFSGKVRIVDYEAAGYGKYIVIRHNNGLETIYGHLSKQIVTENQYVHAGEPIGLGGNTGRSTGSHLHFETRLCGVALNPALMFDFPNQDVTGDFYTYRASTVDNESEMATAARGKAASRGYSRENIQGNGEIHHGSMAQLHQTVRHKIPQAPRSEQPSKAPQMRYYKVEAGESLENVAEKCGVSVETLCRLNHFGRFTVVRKGQLLRYS